MSPPLSPASLDVAALEASFLAAPDPARAALSWATATFGDGLVIASSFSIEDVAVIALTCDAGAEVGLSPRAFMLDTGRLHEQTHETAARTLRALPLRLSILSPERGPLEDFAATHGPAPFRLSAELRKACCHLRKVVPLARALEGAAIWVTGLRREQAPTRAQAPMLAWDAAHGLWKLNPIVAWGEAETLAFVQGRGLPVSPLYAEGFRSIGCAPCTRAITAEDDVRAGRWWWEDPEHRECGLHLSPTPPDRTPDEPMTPPTPAGRSL